MTSLRFTELTDRFLNTLISKLFNYKFHSLKVVSRRRDTQLQVGENNSDFYKMEVNDFEISLIDVTLYLVVFESWCLMQTFIRKII